MVTHWLVHFGPCYRPWSYVLRPGFAHVMAAGYDHELKLWLFIDPKREHTLIEIIPASDTEAIDKRLGLWMASCKPNILRFEQRHERRMSPAMFSCVGAIKGLLGIRSRALSPHGLYRDLVRRGAELVEVPDGIVQHPRPTAGRSQRGALAARGGGAGETRPHQVHAGATTN